MARGAQEDVIQLVSQNPAEGSSEKILAFVRWLKGEVAANELADRIATHGRERQHVPIHHLSLAQWLKSLLLGPSCHEKRSVGAAIAAEPDHGDAVIDLGSSGAGSPGHAN